MEDQTMERKLRTLNEVTLPSIKVTTRGDFLRAFRKQQEAFNKKTIRLSPSSILPDNTNYDIDSDDECDAIPPWMNKFFLASTELEFNTPGLEETRVFMQTIRKAHGCDIRRTDDDWSNYSLLLEYIYCTLPDLFLPEESIANGAPASSSAERIENSCGVEKKFNKANYLAVCERNKQRVISLLNQFAYYQYFSTGKCTKRRNFGNIDEKHYPFFILTTSLFGPKREQLVDYIYSSSENDRHLLEKRIHSVSEALGIEIPEHTDVLQDVPLRHLHRCDKLHFKEQETLVEHCARRQRDKKYTGYLAGDSKGDGSFESTETEPQEEEEEKEEELTPDESETPGESEQTEEEPSQGEEVPREPRVPTEELWDLIERLQKDLEEKKTADKCREEELKAKEISSSELITLVSAENKILKTHSQKMSRLIERLTADKMKAHDTANRYRSKFERLRKMEKQWLNALQELDCLNIPEDASFTSALKSKYENLLEENRKLKEEAPAENRHLQRELDMKQDKIHSLEKRINSLEEEHTNNLEMISEMKVIQNLTTTERETELRTEVERKKAEIIVKDKKLAEMQEAVAGTTADADAKLRQLEADVAEKAKELADVQKEVAGTTADADAKLRQLEADVAEKDKKLGEMQKVVSGTTANTDGKMRQLEADVARLKQECIEKGQEILELKALKSSTNSEASEAMKAANQQLNSVREEARDKSKKIHELEKKLGNKQDAIAGMEKQISELKSQIKQERTESAAAVKVSSAEKEKLIQELRNQHKEKQTKLNADYDKKILQMEMKMDQEKAEREKQSIKLNAKIAQIQGECTTAKRNINDLTSNLKKKEEEIKAKSKEVFELTKKNLELQSSSKQAAGAKSIEIQSAKAVTTATENKNKELLDKLMKKEAELELEKKRWVEKLEKNEEEAQLKEMEHDDTLRRLKSDQEIFITEMELTLNKKEARIAEMGTELTELVTTMGAKVDDLEAKVDESQREKYHLEERLKLKEMELEEIAREISNMENISQPRGAPSEDGNILDKILTPVETNITPRRLSGKTLVDSSKLAQCLRENVDLKKKLCDSM